MAQEHSSLFGAWSACKEALFKYLISEVLKNCEVRLRKYKTMGWTTQMIASLPH